MSNDVIEVLDDLEEFAIASGYYSYALEKWIEQKRSEYAEPKGDCCG